VAILAFYLGLTGAELSPGCMHFGIHHWMKDKNSIGAGVGAASEMKTKF